MTKQDFLAELRKGLAGLPQADIEERITFYSDMIDDRTEDGLSQDEAVAALGSVEEIVDQIVADTPFAKIAKERIKPNRRLKTWEIVLLAVGSPIWLSLGIAAVSVILSLYISLWAVIVSLWAVFGALIGTAVGGIVCGIVSLCVGHTLSGLAVLSAGIVCAGLSVFMFYGCKPATKGLLLMTQKAVVWTKHCFRKKEVAR